MKTIWNFSHPLNSITIQQITAELEDEIEVFDIKVQVDQEKKLKPQVYEICQVASAEGRPRPDYIILPGLAAAAVYADRYFAISEDDYPPTTTYVHLIHLKQEKDSMLPRFVLGSIE